MRVDAAELPVLESGRADAEEPVQHHCEEHSRGVRGDVRMGAGMKGRNGKKELVYSPVLKVNRVANVHFRWPLCQSVPLGASSPGFCIKHVSS